MTYLTWLEGILRAPSVAIPAGGAAGGSLARAQGAANLAKRRRAGYERIRPMP